MNTGKQIQSIYKLTAMDYTQEISMSLIEYFTKYKSVFEELQYCVLNLKSLKRCALEFEESQRHAANITVCGVSINPQSKLSGNENNKKNDRPENT